MSSLGFILFLAIYIYNIYNIIFILYTLRKMCSILDNDSGTGELDKVTFWNQDPLAYTGGTH